MLCCYNRAKNNDGSESRGVGWGRRRSRRMMIPMRRESKRALSPRYLYFRVILHEWLGISGALKQSCKERMTRESVVVWTSSLQDGEIKQTQLYIQLAAAYFSSA